MGVGNKPTRADRAYLQTSAKQEAALAIEEAKKAFAARLEQINQARHNFCRSHYFNKLKFIFSR